MSFEKATSLNVLYVSKFAIIKTNIKATVYGDVIEERDDNDDSDFGIDNDDSDLGIDNDDTDLGIDNDDTDLGIDNDDTDLGIDFDIDDAFLAIDNIDDIAIFLLLH